MSFVGGFILPEHPMAQRAVVLVLKRLRRRGHGLLEESRIKFGTPWTLFVFNFLSKCKKCTITPVII